MSLYVALGISAFIDGLFFAIQTKTGYDVSPTGIGLLFINTLEPLIGENFLWQVELIKWVLTILPILITVALIIKVGWKIGLAIFIPILLGSYFLFISI